MSGCVGVSTLGVPRPTSKIIVRVPAQMGWHEMEHKGENAARVILRQGDALAVGVTSVREGERVSLLVSPFSRATPPLAWRP
jgi:hypothetical protein